VIVATALLSQSAEKLSDNPSESLAVIVIVSDRPGTTPTPSKLEEIPEYSGTGIGLGRVDFWHPLAKTRIRADIARPLEYHRTNMTFLLRFL
jgi:hypothetical protein